MSADGNGPELVPHAPYTSNWPRDFHLVTTMKYPDKGISDSDHFSCLTANIDQHHDQSLRLGSRGVLYVPQSCQTAIVIVTASKLGLFVQPNKPGDVTKNVIFMDRVIIYDMSRIDRNDAPILLKSVGFVFYFQWDVHLSNFTSSPSNNGLWKTCNSTQPGVCYTRSQHITRSRRRHFPILQIKPQFSAASMLESLVLTHPRYSNGSGNLQVNTLVIGG